MVKTELALGRGALKEGARKSHVMRAREVAEAIAFLCKQSAKVRVPLMTVRHMGRGGGLC